MTPLIGGSVGKLSGGNFSDAALAAAFQRLFNEEGGEEAEDPAEEQKEAKEENQEVMDAVAASKVIEQIKYYNPNFNGDGFSNSDLEGILEVYRDSGICRYDGKIDPNQLKNHLFGKSIHLLDQDLAKKFETQEEAYRAVAGRVQYLVNHGVLAPGKFEVNQEVSGVLLGIRGIVLPGGQVRLGTFYVPSSQFP